MEKERTWVNEEEPRVVEEAGLCTACHAVRSQTQQPSALYPREHVGGIIRVGVDTEERFKFGVPLGHSLLRATMGTRAKEAS